MAKTLRILTASGYTTKNSPLTYAELDQNFIELSAELAGLPTPVQSVSVSGGGLVLAGTATAPILSASPMVGATSSTAGVLGSVPAPLAGQEKLYLKGNGTWANPLPTGTAIGQTLIWNGTDWIVGPDPAEQLIIQSGGTLAWDLAAIVNARVTLGANITSLSLSNARPGASYALRLVQDATGSRSIAWPITFRWEYGAVPVLSSNPNAVDLLLLYSFDGTSFIATLLKSIA